MRRVCFSAVVFFLISFFSACAVMESRLAPEADGMVYYLPRSLMRVTVSPEPGEKNRPIGATFNFEPVYISDLSHRYVLNYQNNPLFHDRLCVMAGADGMLSSIEYASQDATPRILVALAELGAKTTRRGPSAAIIARDIGRAAPRIEPFNIVFDPFDTQSIEETNLHINGRLGLDSASGYRIEFALPARRPRQSCDGKGVCFRTKVKTAVRLKKGERVVGFDTVEVMSDHIGSIDLSRAFLVEKVMRLSFESGALTELIMRKPSEMLQAVKLPLDVLDVLLAVPTNFVNNITGTAAARDAYVAELDARTKAIENINTNLAKIAQRTTSNDSSFQNENNFKIKCEGKVLKGS